MIWAILYIVAGFIVAVLDAKYGAVTRERSRYDADLFIMAWALWPIFGLFLAYHWCLRVPISVLLRALR